MPSVKGFSDKDVSYMRSALALAGRGLGRVWPNPSVGCVIARDGVVLGRARTADTGRPHAETQAIDMAGGGAAGADMYVTLEPCAHTGMTPPCCDAIVSAGLRRVFVACPDTDRRTAGKGIEAMQRGGVEVRVGLLEGEARDLNRGYFISRDIGRPMFSLKLATTLDARIATGNGESRWITGAPAQRRVHLERACHDAVLTGIGTVAADDPELNVRLEGARVNPLRVVIDTDLRIPPQSRILRKSGHGPVWIFTAAPERAGKLLQTSKAEVEVEIIPVSRGADGHCKLNEIAAVLGGRGLTRVMVEAGGTLSAAFVRSGLCDRILWFRAPKLMGGDGMPVMGPLGIEEIERMLPFRRTGFGTCGEDSLEIFESSK